MSTHRISAYTAPHELTLGLPDGDIVLLFRPEVDPDEIVDMYADVFEAQRGLSDMPEPDQVRRLNHATRQVVASMMLPESVERFADLKLSQRVLNEMAQWAMELYGARPTGRSAASSPSSPAKPPRSTGSSRSKG